MSKKKGKTGKKQKASRKTEPKHQEVGNKRVSERVTQRFWRHVQEQIQQCVKKDDDYLEFSFPVEKYREEVLQLPPYRRLKHNLYRPPLSRPSFNEDTDAFVCNCSLTTGGCGPRCQNRLIYTECSPELCPCTQTNSLTGEVIPCSNTVIQFQNYPATEVFQTASCGYGLRVIEDVPAHTIIVEYLGEIITFPEMQKRMKTYKSKDHFYFATLGEGYMVDASSMGSIARFANHSCQPNCSLQRWTVRNESRIVLVSNRDLPKHTEITYHYNFSDDGWQHNPIRSQKCYCGSVFCNGYVGASQKNVKYEQLLQLLEKSQQLLEMFEAPVNNTQEEESETEEEEEREQEEVKLGIGIGSQKHRSKDSIQSFLQQVEAFLSTYSLPSSSFSSSSSSSSSSATTTSLSTEEIQLQSLQSTTAHLSTHFADYLQLESAFSSSLFSSSSNSNSNRSPSSASSLLSLSQTQQLLGLYQQLLTRYPRITSPALKSFREQTLPYYQKVLKRLIVWRHRFGLSSSEASSLLRGGFEEEAVSSSPPPSETSNSNRYILWDEYIDLIAVVYESCLPLYTPYLAWLLSLYLQTNTFFINSPLTLLVQSTPFQEPLTVTATASASASALMKRKKKIVSLDRSYASQSSCLKRLLSLTLSNSNSSNSNNIIVSESLFYLASYWNEYLSVYMDKNQLGVEVVSYKDKDKDHMVTLNNGVVIPQTIITSNNNTNKCKKGERSQQSHHCYCHLRDEDGDHSLMSQCSDCLQWFHLACLNLSPAVFHQLSRSQEQEQVVFRCVTCQFRSRQCSSYCLEPTYEWKYQKELVSPTTTTTTTADSRGRKANHPEEEEVKALQQFLDQQRQLLLSCDNTLEESSNSNNSDDHNDGKELMRSLFQQLHSLQTTLTTNKKRGLVYYLTTEAVSQLLQDSESLSLQWSPAISFLSLTRQFLHHWTDRIRQLYSTHFSLLADFITDCTNNSNSSSNSSNSESWTALAQFLERLLVLYVDPQILHVKDSVYLPLLRETIWLVASLPVLTAAAAVSRSSNSNNSNSHPPLCRWSQLQKMKDYGETLFSRVTKTAQKLQTLQQKSPLKSSDDTASSASFFLSSTYLTLSKLFSVVVPAVTELWREGVEIQKLLSGEIPLDSYNNNSNSNNTNSNTVEQLVTRMGQYTQLIDLSQEEGCYRTWRCLLRPTSLYSRSQTPTTTSESTSSSTSSSSQYCWCRAGDDGSEMICCDRCEEWFHTRCLPTTTTTRKGAKQQQKKRRTKRCEGGSEKKGKKVKKSETSPSLNLNPDPDQREGSIVSSSIEETIGEAGGEPQSKDQCFGSVVVEEEKEEEEEKSFYCLSCRLLQHIKLN